MSSPFFGMDIALRGLYAARTAMDVVAHNVSNANTDGYSRQNVNLATTDPFTNPSFYKPLSSGQLGTGVQVISIERLRDQSLEFQIRNNTQLLGQYSAKSDIFLRIEAVFNEPGAVGLNSLIDEFFNSFSELSTSPESSVVRAQVRQAGQSLTEYFNKLSEDLTYLGEDVDEEIRVTVDGVNSLLSQLRDVNQLITGIIPTGDDPNDLLDKRDYLLEQINQYIDVDVSEQLDGTVNVYVGGRIVVQRDILKQLAVVDDPNNNNYAAIKIEDDLSGADVAIEGGEVKGLLDIRDSSEFGIPAYKDQLDTLAYNLIEKINAQHQAGFGLDGGTNRNFFTPTALSGAAMSITLSGDILDEVSGLNRIAAASTAASVPGDGSNALTLSQLQNDSTAVGDSTFNEYYASLISQLGVYSQIESNKVDNQEFLMNQLYSLRDDVSGVSLDEEAAKIVMYQNAYNAAANVIEIMNETYQILIEMMG